MCYEGGLSEDTHKPLDTRTAEQMVVLHEVLTALHEACPEARIVGHHELNEKKACPCLGVAASHEYAYICPHPLTLASFGAREQSSEPPVGDEGSR